VTLPLASRMALLAAVMASAARAEDVAVMRGEKVFQYCFSCHSVKSGETNLQGPNLRGIVGGKIASQPGFEYSPAMRAFAQRHERWSGKLLDRYIADPQQVVPLTSMGFHGVSEREERADLLAYLRAMNDKP
jgi:cytochrome c